MINSDILLFPDTGPEFIRALKTAVLYSERVQTKETGQKKRVKSGVEKSTLSCRREAAPEEATYATRDLTQRTQEICSNTQSLNEVELATPPLRVQVQYLDKRARKDSMLALV